MGKSSFALSTIKLGGKKSDLSFSQVIQLRRFCKIGAGANMNQVKSD